MKNRNLERIKALREVINSKLSPLIDDDYSLLDIPCHNNIGDSLIYQGEMVFLRSFNYNLLYKSSARFGKISDIPKRGTLLLHGGGNFGDLWHESHDFRRELISKRPNQKILLFPQTVYYNDLKLINKDILIYNSHPDLTLCARDLRSFQILKKYFTSCSVLLVPDMAFCLNLKADDFGVKRANLFLRRMDLESDGREDLYLDYVKKMSEGAVLKVGDWPGMYYMSGTKRKIIEKRRYFLTNVYSFLRKEGLDKYLVNSCYGFEGKRKGENLVQKGVVFFSSFDKVFTNRLHGMILSILLGKEVVCFDNCYGKNIGFYQSWLSEFENCSFKSF